MKKLLYLILFGILSISLTQDDDFKASQLKYERVRNAYRLKEHVLIDYLKKQGINDFNFQLYIRAFKEEECVEVWVKANGSSKYVHLTDYQICSSSGSLGPKRQQGDGQVPEGVYYINRFNPSSNFYLSLGLNYPNASDAMRGKQGSLGGDIFIHGKCVTIGCIPITDDKIMELYVLAVEARQHGQTKIPVHIFPFMMEKVVFGKYRNLQTYKGIISFWEELEPVYLKFQNTKKLPVISISSTGKYIVN